MERENGERRGLRRRRRRRGLVSPRKVIEWARVVAGLFNRFDVYSR